MEKKLKMLIYGAIAVVVVVIVLWVMSPQEIQTGPIDDIYNGSELTFSSESAEELASYISTEKSNIVLTNFLEMHAFVNDDVSICQRSDTTYMEDECSAMFYLFKSLEGESQCSMISDTNHRELCNALSSNDELECPKSDDWNILCRSLVNSDQVLCSELAQLPSPESTEIECKNDIILTNAIRTSDSSLCNGMVDIDEYSKKRMCECMVLKEVNCFDPDYSERFTVWIIEIYKAIDYRMLLDVSDCENIVMDDAKQQCISVVSRNIDGCEQIGNGELQLRCLFQVLGPEEFELFANFDGPDDIKCKRFPIICMRD